MDGDETEYHWTGEFYSVLPLLYDAEKNIKNADKRQDAAYHLHILLKLNTSGSESSDAKNIRNAQIDACQFLRKHPKFAAEYGLQGVLERAERRNNVRPGKLKIAKMHHYSFAIPQKGKLDLNERIRQFENIKLGIDKNMNKQLNEAIRLQQQEQRIQEQQQIQAQRREVQQQNQSQ